MKNIVLLCRLLATRLKLEKAAHMLRSPSDEMDETAAMVGFRQTSYFIEVFQ